jgi:RHS repeat-associated protein
VENLLQGASGPGGEEYYGYGADNRRVYQSQLDVPATGTTKEYVTLWSVGKRVGRYKLLWTGSTFAFEFTAASTNVYFGGKPLRLGAETNVVTDRLGSIRRNAKDFFPYGEERTLSGGDKEKYATYLHDKSTDLSYADQRYYATGAGRFMTADPAGAGLNWYGYT